MVKTDDLDGDAGAVAEAAHAAYAEDAEVIA